MRASLAAHRDLDQSITADDDGADFSHDAELGFGMCTLCLSSLCFCLLLFAIRILHGCLPLLSTCTAAGKLGLESEIKLISMMEDAGLDSLLRSLFERLGLQMLHIITRMYGRLTSINLSPGCPDLMPVFISVHRMVLLKKSCQTPQQNL